MEGKVHIGDMIKLDGTIEGKIEHIGVQYTLVRKSKGMSLLTVPNQLYASKVLERLTEENAQHLKVKIPIDIEDPMLLDQTIHSIRSVLNTLPEIDHTREFSVFIDSIDSQCPHLLVCAYIASDEPKCLLRAKHQVILGFLQAKESLKTTNV